MLNNKLDPDITENPEKLVVYGGMDVLDIVHNPAPPAADPGGMYTEVVFKAVQLAGQYPKVKATILFVET